MLSHFITKIPSDSPGIAVGINHDDDPIVLQEILENMGTLKQQGFTHVGLEIFKKGNLGQAIGVQMLGDEAAGLRKYTSDEADENDQDVQCALAKAERADVRDYFLQHNIPFEIRLDTLQNIYKYQLQNPDSITQQDAKVKEQLAIYRQALSETAHSGYRKLMEEARTIRLIFIGIDDYARIRMEGDEKIIKGNEFFANELNATKNVNSKAKIAVFCGAMHVVNYRPDQKKTDNEKPEDENLSIGIADQFKLTPVFYGEKSINTINEFPKKIDTKQVNSIQLIALNKKSLLSK